MAFFGRGGSLAKIGNTLSGIGDGLGYGMDYAMGNDRGVERFERNRNEEEERRLRMENVQRLAQSLQAQGLTPDQVSMAMTDPGSIGSNFNQRFQPEKKPEPTTFQRNSEYLNSQQAGLGNTYLQNQADPLRFIEAQGPGGTKTLYPMRSGGGQPQGGGLQPGTIRDGYQYKGGNPNDQNSWSPVQGGQGGPGTGYNGQGAPTMRQSLGEQGFQQWLRQHSISIRP